MAYMKLIRKLFKPALGRVILSAVIGILSLLLIYMYSASHVLVCTSRGCPTIEKVAFSTTLNSVIPVLIFSYILSCIIVSIFNRIDHKNIWVPIIKKMKRKGKSEKKSKDNDDKIPGKKKGMEEEK